MSDAELEKLLQTSTHLQYMDLLKAQVDEKERRRIREIRWRVEFEKRGN